MFTVTDKKQQQNAFASAPKNAASMQSADRPLDSLDLMQRSLGNSYLQATSQTSLPSCELRIQRACACRGSCANCMQREDDPRKFQAKLAVGSPDDVYEREADRVADQVMATSTHSAFSATPPRIQRFSGQTNGQMDAAPASVDQALARPGSPLEPTLRLNMEQSFGHDFSRVRVHSDTAADQSARDVNANAYTVGHNIVFGACQFSPETHEGRRLIAHELTHVVQQSGSNGSHAANEGVSLQRTPSHADNTYASMPLEEAIKNLPKMPQDQALLVLKRYQQSIINSINADFHEG